VFQQQPAYGIQMRPTLARGWIRLATEGVALQLEDGIEVGDLMVDVLSGGVHGSSPEPTARHRSRRL
jgi:hypothetical protein